MTTKLHHVACQTDNFEKALRFYTELFELKLIKKPYQYKERLLCLIDAESAIIELYTVKSSDTPTPNEMNGVGPHHIAFTVDDLDMFIRRCYEFRIRVIKEPFIPPSGDAAQKRIAFIEGPDSEEVEVREL
ncbi:MAG: VOC family protein [Deltaproteobacteria bacterium]|nr:VOC family protein [Deltaproteobacteria bacterium]